MALLTCSVCVPTILIAAATGVYSHAAGLPPAQSVASRAPEITSAPTATPPTTPTSTTPTTTAAPSTTTPSTTTPPPAPEPPPALSLEQQQALAAGVQRAVQSEVPGTQVGLEVFDRRTGAVLTSLNPAEQFAAMSVVKIFIAVDALAANNWAPPAQSTVQNVSQMLSASDDGIADDMWDAGGGTAIINRDVALMGLTGTAPPEDPGEWGDTQITARDMTTVYRYLAEAMPAPDRDVLYGAMFHAPKLAADGTDQYFGIPDGLPGTTWAIKQGWGTSGSTAVYNTTGLLGTDSRYVVVVLTAAPARDYGLLPAAITAGAGRLASVLG